MTVSHRPPAKLAAVLRLPPPTIQNDLELYEEMRTRRIEVRGTGVPAAEATQKMDTLDGAALDPSTHGST